MRFYLTILVATALTLASPIYAANFFQVMQGYNAGGGGLTPLFSSDLKTLEIEHSGQPTPVALPLITHRLAFR